jgi:hypothetical protein
LLCFQQTDVVGAEALHQAADVAGVPWCHEEMHLVVHQDLGMQAAVRRGQRCPQELQVAQSIAIVEGAGQPVVAALDHVLRDAGEVEAGEAGLASGPARAGGRLPSMQPWCVARISPRSDAGKFTWSRQPAVSTVDRWHLPFP